LGDIRDKALDDYRTGMSPTKIAERYGISVNTVKSWIARWKKGAGVQVQKDAPQDARGATERQDSNPVIHVDKMIAEAVEENAILTPKQKDFCFFFVKNNNAVQAYIKAYQTTHRDACAHAWTLLNHVEVAKEVKRLRILKNTALGGMMGEDIVELHTRIAFADITDFVEFENKQVPVLKDNVPVLSFCPETEEAKELRRNVNEVRLKSSDAVDGNLISEVSDGREGTKIKLADRHKSLAFLTKYHGLVGKEPDADSDIVDDWLRGVTGG